MTLYPNKPLSFNIPNPSTLKKRKPKQLFTLRDFQLESKCLKSRHEKGRKALKNEHQPSLSKIILFHRKRDRKMMLRTLIPAQSSL